MSDNGEIYSEELSETGLIDMLDTYDLPTMESSTPQDIYILIPGQAPDQQLPSLQGEEGNPPDPMVPGTAVDQQLLASTAERSIQVSGSSHTSRERAIPGTSSGRRGKKRSSTQEEGNKKIPKYMQDHTDPSLTPAQRDSIKNSKNAKKNRDEKENKLRQLQQEIDQLRMENDKLRTQNKHQSQILLEMRKLVTSLQDPGMPQ